MKANKYVYDLARGDLLMVVFIERALDRALRFGATDQWDTDLLTLDHLNRLLEGEVVLDTQSQDFEGLILDLRNAVVSISLERGEGRTPSVTVDVHATSRKAATLEMARLKELLPEAEAGVYRPRVRIGFVTPHEARAGSTVE